MTRIYRILIVDDELAAATSLSKSLLRFGYDVVAISEGYYAEDHPKWGRLLKDPKDDSFWEEKTIGKTAMDYAIYLIGKNAA